MEITKVIEIQIGGGPIVHTLEEACREYIRLLDSGEPIRAKIHFTIEAKHGETRVITIRDDDDLGTVAYGDFEGLSSFLEYAKEVIKEGVLDESAKG